MRGVWLAPLLLLFGGCALPPAIQVASLIADGFSYFATGKSVTDHGISMVAEKDCAVFRVVKGEEICREDEGDATATAFALTEEEEDFAADEAADTYAPAAAHFAIGYERSM